MSFAQNVLEELPKSGRGDKVDRKTLRRLLMISGTIIIVIIVINISFLYFTYHISCCQLSSQTTLIQGFSKDYMQILIIVVINSSLLLKHDIPGKTCTCTCTS